jgi:hypothetical protein
MTEAPPPFATVLTDAYLSAIESARDHGVTLTLDDENGIRNALISPIRAAMIRDEFNAEREVGVKSEAIQARLAVKFNLSYSRIHSILFRGEDKENE